MKNGWPKKKLRKLRGVLPKSPFFAVLSGIATYVPGLLSYQSEPCFAEAPRYNYSVWLRHLVAAHNYGLNAVPGTVAELGPGNSLGVGLAAILSGADRLYALDVVDYTSTQRNLNTFEHLLEMFRRREGIPDEGEFPALLPKLDSYNFPSDILSEKMLNVALRPERLEAIRNAIRQEDAVENIVIQYKCPWWSSEIMQRGEVDMVLSQYVLEHVDRLDTTYSAIEKWLKPGGFSSHVVDFSCHNLVQQWNGHWQFGSLAWRLVRGRKPYLLNRAPCSRHLELAACNGFFLQHVQSEKASSIFQQKNLATEFKGLSDDDITTKSAYILSKKTS